MRCVLLVLGAVASGFVAGLWRVARELAALEFELDAPGHPDRLHVHFDRRLVQQARLFLWARTVVGLAAFVASAALDLDLSWLGTAAAVALLLLARFAVGVQELPANQRVVHESLQHGVEAVALGAEHSHHVHASASVVSLDPRHLHGIYEHSGEPERHFFGKFGAFHRHLEAVSKVDVHDSPRSSLHHEVAWVAVAEAQDVAGDAHGGQRAGERGAPAEPHL
mmetsp:Transcript_56734/g.112076  ORF Transcript_56734/g.112076 Transcript_56734/m.112076 type:complete len:223 (-) Transcript_56734:1567-2235(-)